MNIYETRKLMDLQYLYTGDHESTKVIPIYTYAVLCLYHLKKEQKLGNKTFHLKFIGCRDENL